MGLSGLKGGGGGGGMVTDFSGIYLLSYEFVVIGRASTDNPGVICGHRRQKVAQRTKI